jgi:SAM-dependent methyltransferase
MAALSTEEDFDFTKEEYYQKLESLWSQEYPSHQCEDAVWDMYKEFGYEDPRKTLNSILEKVKWNKNKVLDFGCDTGFMLDFICKSRNGLSGYGIDINKTAIAQASALFPEYKFDAYGGLKLPYEDKTFDLVFASTVIKHIRHEDRDIVYRELKRVADQVFFVEADKELVEESKFGNWTFYHSHFEKEFAENFTPIVVMKEGGDILGLYSC